MSSPPSIHRLSHYPSIPPPVPVDLWDSPPHPCPYLPGRMATMRAVMSNHVSPEIYHQFMDANFRRSGRVIYQPALLPWLLGARLRRDELQSVVRSARSAGIGRHLARRGIVVE